MIVVETSISEVIAFPQWDWMLEIKKRPIGEKLDEWPGVAEGESPHALLLVVHGRSLASYPVLHYGSKEDCVLVRQAIFQTLAFPVPPMPPPPGPDASQGEIADWEDARKASLRTPGDPITLSIPDMLDARSEMSGKPEPFSK